MEELELLKFNLRQFEAQKNMLSGGCCHAHVVDKVALSELDKKIKEINDKINSHRKVTN